MTKLPPRAWTNLLAYGASPPEYPGLVLVPKEVLNELREWSEGERVNVAATGQSLSNGETWEDGWERGWRAGANATEAPDGEVITDANGDELERGAGDKAEALHCKGCDGTDMTLGELVRAHNGDKAEAPE